MKKIRILTAAISILFLAVSCESVGLLGFGGVKGDKAKKEILAIAQETGIINYGIVSGQSAGEVGFGIVIDGVLTPGVAGIRDSEHYSRPSVDDCKKKISTVGLVITVWFSAITCDLKTTPMLLQIGDGDTGNVLQLGPLGL